MAWFIWLEMQHSNALGLKVTGSVLTSGLDRSTEIEPHILIIDDARSIRSLSGQYLRRQGFHTRLEANAAEARKAVGEAAGSADHT